MKRALKVKKSFKKDYKKMAQSGRFDMKKLEEVMDLLIEGKLLDPSYNDHPLKGEWKDHRDCHIEGDWVLIYKIEKKSDGTETVIFSRTGNHSNILT